MKTRLTLILVLLIYIGAASHTHAQQKKVIKTMMIAGQDGSHYWQGACEAMKQILENSGMFKVDFAFTPDFGGDIATFKPDFHQYDLIVINYGGATWTEPVRKNFEKYVADGGGVVVIHSSVVPMADWKEYNEIIGMGAWDGRNEKDGPYLYWKDGQYVYDYSPALHHLPVYTSRQPAVRFHDAGGHLWLEGHGAALLQRCEQSGFPHGPGLLYHLRYLRGAGQLAGGRPGCGH